MPPPAGPQPVGGGESLTWHQPVARPEDAAGLGFRIYVNGEPDTLGGVHCGEAGPAGVPCRADLPRLPAGVHELVVVAYALADPFHESPASNAVTISLQAPAGDPGDGDAGGDAGGADDADAPQSMPGTSASASALAPRFSDPTDLTVLPDGRVLVAERQGRIHLVEDGIPQPGAVLQLADVATGHGRGLLSLAVAADFARTRAVFVLYTTDAGLRLARFELAGGSLVARAILADGLPVADLYPHAVLRVGADGSLLVALDDAGDRGAALDRGSLSGKLLRLRPDGGTPDDQPAPATGLDGLHAPTAIVADDATGIVWVADRVDDQGAVLRRQPSGDGPALDRIALPATADGRGVVVASDGARGLLVASDDWAGRVLHLTPATATGIAQATTWRAGAAAPIRAMARGADGRVHVLTATAVIVLGRSGH